MPGHPAALTQDQAQELDGGEAMAYIALHPGVINAVRSVMEDHNIELVRVPAGIEVAESPTYVVAPRYL